MRKLIGAFGVLGIMVVTSAAYAQMCGGAGASAGACSMAQPAQAQPGQSAMPGMGGMMQGQPQPGQQGQGMMMQGCPMMKQMAALQERVRHMEDMMRVAPQQQGTEPPTQQ